jgi:hypothetical protein
MRGISNAQFTSVRGSFTRGAKLIQYRDFMCCQLHLKNGLIMISLSGPAMYSFGGKK